MSNSLRLHELQHVWPPCPSPSPRVCSDSLPLSWWCHPTISSSVTPFSCPQPLRVSGYFSVSRLFTSGDQSIGASTPMNIYIWFFLGLSGLISLQSKGFSSLFLLQHHSPKASILWHSAFFMVQLSYRYMTTGKTWLYRPLSAKWCFYFLICCLSCHNFFPQGASIF